MISVSLPPADSATITAALLKEALGPDRVLGVLMPNDDQPDIEDAKEAIRCLGIRSRMVNIRYAYRDILGCVRDTIDPLSDDVVVVGNPISKDTGINVAPRIRMTILYAIAQSLPEGGRVINTCNRSEDYVGYSTKFGDAAGDFSLLAGYIKSEVVAIGRTFTGLPEHLIEKAPSDGLCGLTDEDRFGFTYDELDRYILAKDQGAVAGLPEGVVEKIERMHEQGVRELTST